MKRRELLIGGAAALALPAWALPAWAQDRKPKRVAAVTTVYHHNSHADVILSRLLQGWNLDFQDPKPALELAGLYVDQFPASDMSRKLAEKHGFKLCGSIREALTLGTGGLAVDGVLLVGEHGQYPPGEREEETYPRKRFFDETVAVFKESKRSVPVFNDKHLSHLWPEAKEMYDTSRQMRFPLMAGSSVPLTWRKPAIEVEQGAPLRELVAVSYHTLYGYGFHALEMAQCLAERRKGGETGVRRVQCLEGPAVWEAGKSGRYDLGLLDTALGKLTRPIVGATAEERLAALQKNVARPAVYLIEYRDGFKSAILTLNYAIGEWSAAWSTRGKREPEATLFWTQEARPFGHFSFLVRGIESHIFQEKPPWPVERTLLTTGQMHFLLESRFRGGKVLDTPELAIRYRPTWDWKDPGPPPASRPVDQQ